MYEDILFISRGIETIRASQHSETNQESSCKDQADGFYTFRRSKAIRRKELPPRLAAIQRVQSVRRVEHKTVDKHFQIPDSSTYTKCLRRLKMKEVRLKQVIRYGNFRPARRKPTEDQNKKISGKSVENLSKPKKTVVEFGWVAKLRYPRKLSHGGDTSSDRQSLARKAMANYMIFIEHGSWISANNNKEFEVINPANGQVIATVPDMDVKDTQKAIESAAEAFRTWQYTTAKERSTLLRKWYNLLVENQDSIAKVMTAESGKPLAEALGEVNYGNSFIEWFSEQARNIRGEIISSPVATKKMFVEHNPIGVAALITPWNFPHAMITRKAGAALSAGCTCVIKPAEDTPLTALALMKLAEEAGIPKGVLNVVTSSTEVGKILYKQCASGIKRLGLELGGNAPFIVYNSANLQKAISGALVSKFRNCGQTCVASNRFLVQDKIYDAFVAKLVEEVNKLKLGDGSKPGINLGPLINQAQFKKVSELVEDAVSKGAEVKTGGKPAPDLGKLFYKPTVLTNVKDGMLAYTEEVFGPVINIIRFETEEESLQIANNTERGLAGYFFSEDVSQIFRVARKLEVGMIGVNEGLISTAEAPFGGVKESGLGREGSHHGIEEYTYIKVARKLELGMIGVNEGLMLTAEAPFGGVKESELGREHSHHGIEEYTYIKLQQVDGGFFEKFGSLFREQAEFAQTQDQIERERVALAAAEAAPKKEEEETCAAPDTEKKTEDGVEADETSLASSDSDSELVAEKDDAAELIAAAFNTCQFFSKMMRPCVSECNLTNGHVTPVQAVLRRKKSLSKLNFRGIKKDELQRRTSMYLASMTIDELYCEILFEILHNVGCDISYEVGQTALFSYAQDAFKIPNDKHRGNVDLFPDTLYPWVTYQDERTVPTVLNDAVAQGANDWLNHILENNNNKPENSNVGKLQGMIQIIQLVRSDLQKAIEFYDKFFQEIVNFQFAKALYVFYQARICILYEPDVIEICKNLRSLRYSSYNDLTKEEGSPDPLAEGTSLFELYLALQRFATLGIGLCPADYDTFHIKNFHQWFHGGVAQWLDIAVYKALQRIEKAVELDKLIHVDSNVKYSSSAVDTLTIFYQVKVFWEQLNWPDVESCYTFIAKIIDDICRCCVFYADKMSARVEGMGDTQDDKKFEVTPEWCLAINNIDYVRETLEPFTRDLGMDDVIHKIGEMKSPVEAQRCQHTLDNVIANAIDTVRNKIIELLETVVNKKRRPPAFFANLRKTLNLMTGSFKNPQDCDNNCDDLRRTEQILRLNGLETAELIHEVHLGLANEFKKAKDSQLGEISVRTKFEESTLTIEVMNGRNLLAMDSNGTCDAFVRLHLLPEDKFSNVEKPKTKTHNRTQFPLFDETKLTPEQRQLDDALILFSVKDKDLLGYNNQYIGEAYISFKDIEDTSQSISVLPQIHLQLARPTEKSMSLDSIKALEYRQGDKQAKEFLRKLKQRMGS
nr:unnamed protein product [Callosobruchus analis]